VRKQGLSALSQLKNNVETLENPIAPLAHGIMILLAGALLLTPGFFTDAVGFSLLVPNIRIWLFERVKQRILHSQNGFSFTHARTGGAKHSSQNGERHASGTTIEGVYEELAPKNDP
jgi:UPF0716 protein FxsA